jgi:hypothetical protein
MEESINMEAVPQSTEAEKASSPPYISFLTFTNFLTWLETEGVPLQFDRSFWSKKYSGSTGFHLMSSLRFLGLLKVDKPQPSLETLVEAKGDERKTKLAEVIRNSYTEVEFDALARATPKMLTDWFRNYGLDGDTLRKAESFFINACKFVEISLSPSLRKKARNKPARSVTGAAKERKRRKEKPSLPEDKGDSGKGSTSEGAQVNRVVLASGGDVTLTVNVDLFQLSKEDRDFVLSLIDIIKGYGGKKEL